MNPIYFHASPRLSSMSQVSSDRQHPYTDRAGKTSSMPHRSLRSSMRQMRAEEQFIRSHFIADERWLAETSIGDLEKPGGYERLLRMLDEGYFQKDECKGEGDEYEFGRLWNQIENARVAMFIAGLANRPEEGIQISTSRVESFRRMVAMLSDRKYQSEIGRDERTEVLMMLAFLDAHFEGKSEIAKGLNLLIMNDFDGAKQAFTTAGNRDNLTFDRIILLKILEQRLGQSFLSKEPSLIDKVPRNERTLWLFRTGDYQGALNEIESRKNDRFHPYGEYDREIRIFSNAFLGRHEEGMGTRLELPLLYYISGNEQKAKESLNLLPAKYGNLAELAPFLLLIKAIEQFDHQKKQTHLS